MVLIPGQNPGPEFPEQGIVETSLRVRRSQFYWLMIKKYNHVAKLKYYKNRTIPWWYCISMLLPDFSMFIQVRIFLVSMFNCQFDSSRGNINKFLIFLMLFFISRRFILESIPLAHWVQASSSRRWWLRQGRAVWLLRVVRIRAWWKSYARRNISCPGRLPW